MQSYEFEDIAGTVVFRADNRWVLLDTGSPLTFAACRSWNFLGRPREPAPDILGVLASVRELLDPRLEVLLGCDLLRELPFEIDWEAHEVRFRDAPGRGGLRLPLAGPQGLPLVRGALAGEPVRLIPDTGAGINYLVAERLRGPAAGVHRDFYPLAGRFETPVHRIPLTLGEREFTPSWGKLPPVLDPLRLLADGILGTTLMRPRVRFDLAGRELTLEAAPLAVA